MQPELPNKIPGVHKYSRVHFKTKQYYIPRMAGYKYAVALDRLEHHGSPHTDAHMFFMKIQE